MTDFITTINNGTDGGRFAADFWANVPATVPSGDRYICEIGTETLNEDMVMDQRIVNGDIIVRPVSGQGHTGVRNTGIQVGRSSATAANLMTHDCTGTGQIIVEDLELRFGVATNTNSGMIAPETTNTPTVIVQRCLITNVNTGNTRPIDIPTDVAGDFHFISNRFWDEGGVSGARMLQGFLSSGSPSGISIIIQGNVFQVTGGAIQRGISLPIGAGATPGTLLDVQGNIVLGSPEDYRVTNAEPGTSTLIFEQNLSEDATGQVTGATVANDLVSVDNPDVKTGSIALQVWTNEPTAFGAEIDIRGFNRSAVALLAEWDAGSMQFSVGALPPSDAAGNITRPAAFSNIFDITRNTAPDIIF